MAQTNADVLALQLEKVRDKLPLLYERDNVFFAKVEKKGDKVSSRNMRVPLQLRPGGRGGIYNPDGGAMGRGGATIYNVAQLTPVHLKFAVEVNKLVEMATNSSEKAIENAFKVEIKNSMSQFRAFVDKLSQQSSTGQLGTISSIAGTTWTLSASNFSARQRFYVGQGLVLAVAALTSMRAGTAIVTSIDDPNNKITVDANPTSAAATDVILPEGSSASGGAVTTTALFGIPYHQNDATSGTWLGLTRDATTLPEVITSSVNASSAALTWSMIRLAVNKIRLALGGQITGGLTAYMHPAQVDAYEQLLLAITRVDKEPGDGSDQSVDLGFAPKTIAGAPILQSINADPTRIDFLNFDSWGRAVMQDIDYFTIGDQKTFYPIDSTTGSPIAASLFYYTTSFQYFVDNPLRGSYIKTLAKPAGY